MTDANATSNSAGLPAADVAAEARRITSAASAVRVEVRLLGGVAIDLHKHRPVAAALQRTYADLDVVVRKGHDGGLKRVLAELGYEADELFNRLHGYRRLLFLDPVNHRQLDVFIGQFQMCHVLDLDKRLGLDPVTLCPADLLLTKLQIVELNAKDVVDTVTLIDQHELGAATDGDVIDVGRLRAVTGRDWGWYTTVVDNLGQVRTRLPALLDDGAVAPIRAKIDDVIAGLEGAPKSPGWKVRAAVGRRVPWYDLPEERER